MESVVLREGVNVWVLNDEVFLGRDQVILCLDGLLLVRADRHEFLKLDKSERVRIMSTGFTQR